MPFYKPREVVASVDPQSSKVLLHCEESGMVRRSGRGLCLPIGLCIVAAVSAVICIVAFQFYQSSQISALRRDVDMLQQQLMEIRGELGGRSILDELKEIKEELGERNILKELKEFEDAEYNEMASLDDDEDDDEEEDEYVDDNEEEDVGKDTKFQGFMVGRAPRQRRDVVPVLQESYGAHNRSGEGLRLYERLVSGQDPPQHPVRDPPPKKHHKASAALSEKQWQLKKQQASPPPSVILRPSRVMETESDASRRSAARLQLQNAAAPSKQSFKVYQEHVAPPPSLVRSSDLVPPANGKHKNRRRKLLPPRLIEGAQRRVLSAAHFSGDTSKYTENDARYDRNGRLMPENGYFADWKASEWVERFGMHNNFQLKNGAVEIRDAGLYFIYAQIYYHDEHDINGYHVYVNDKQVLQCTTMTHTAGSVRSHKLNTCFTGGVEYLNAKDKILLRDITTHRYSLFEPSRSFFGLIKLGDPIPK